jgi:endonuclease/exonuclease/phosphatase (EEP) superfamily protein YafD
MLHSIGKQLLRWAIALGLALFKLGLLGLIAVSGLGYGANRWPWELLSHFRWQYSLLAIAGAAMALGLRWSLAQPKGRGSVRLSIGWVWAALLALGLNLPELLPWYLPQFQLGQLQLGLAAHGAPVPSSSPNPALATTAPQAQQVQALRLLAANVHTENTAFGQTLAAVRQQSPDMAVFTEVTGDWIDALTQGLGAQLPYQVGNGDEILIMSRFPLSPLPRPTPRSVAVDVRLNGREQPLRLIGLHPVVPLFPSSLGDRNQSLTDVANDVATAGKGLQPPNLQLPIIVAGDFNITPWSVAYHQFLERSGLHHAGLGRGIPLSWPMPSTVRRKRPSWLLPLVRIPIDHCLVSRNIGAQDFQVLKNGNSDHAMIVADVQL